MDRKNLLKLIGTSTHQGFEIFASMKNHSFDSCTGFWLNFNSLRFSRFIWDKRSRTAGLLFLPLGFSSNFYQLTKLLEFPVRCGQFFQNSFRDNFSNNPPENYPKWSKISYNIRAAQYSKRMMVQLQTQSPFSLQGPMNVSTFLNEQDNFPTPTSKVLRPEMVIQLKCPSIF